MFAIYYLRTTFRIIIKYGKRYETLKAKFCEETFVVKLEHTKVQVSIMFFFLAMSKL